MPTSPERNRRNSMLAVAFVAVAAGLATRIVPGPGWLRNAFGAMLYEVFWIAFIQALWTRSATLRVAMGVFLATCGVELLQLSDHASLVAIRNTLPGRLLLGGNGGFDWVDIVWYAVGSAAGYFMVRRGRHAS